MDMIEPLVITPQTRVMDLLARAPQVAPLFVELRLGCIGCSMGKFCTLQDLARNYRLPVDKVLNLIKERLGPGASSQAPHAPAFFLQSGHPDEPGVKMGG